MMRRFNLSEWAVKHPSMVVYLMIVLMVAGVFSYRHLGRAEDPDFTFKIMVVRTLWPGASAVEVEQELTDRIEKKLREAPWSNVITSASKPGESMIFVQLKDHTPKTQVVEAWRQIRKRLDDLRPSLPAGIQGPFPNDDFGDVSVSIYALTGDGFDLAALRHEADRMARELYSVPDVKKVELIGVQDEKIYIEATPARLAALHLTPGQVFDALQRQNTLTPAGFIETASDRVRLRVDGPFTGVDKIRDADIVVEGKHFRLGDIATVRRGQAEPPNPRMRVAAKDAIGLAVVMNRGGDVIRLGENLKREMARFHARLPAGIEIHVVADQPAIVKESIDLFLTSLAEAVAIVMTVSFLSLGLRTGTVVALSIPLVLAITFFFMYLFGIDLQRISLGALVIALGLLVDDAIIAVEMMVVKMEQGLDRAKAATFAYTSTAFPMLTGTLITTAAFTPVGFARSNGGEYVFSLFAVVTIALLVSWVVAVVFTPFIGYRLLDAKRLAEFGRNHHGDVYDTPFYRRFRALLVTCLRHRWWVIGATVLLFVGALLAFRFGVDQQFFPASSRPEILIEIRLPAGASLQSTTAETKKIEALLAGDPAIKASSAYIGNGPPRFYLTLDQQLFADNFAQFVIVTKGIDEREDLRRRLLARFAAADGGFSHLRVRVLRLENGPPVGFPVAFRVSGEDLDTLRGVAGDVATVMRAHPNLRDVQFDWNEKIKGLRVEVDQDRARLLGVSSQEVAQALQGWLVGATVTQFREDDQLIDVVWRAAEADRVSLDRLPDLDIVTAGGRHLPLAQVARLQPTLDEGLIWRRDRLPTITVRADTAGDREAPGVSKEIDRQLESLRAKLPSGFHIEQGGLVEESTKNEVPIMAVMPFMIVAVITLLMMQLQSMSRTFLVLLTAPLGLIGVATALLFFHAPYGFVANVGVIAMMGMILRNSVILMDQIERDEKAGKSRWEAIIGSTVRRFRPIVLTAAAAFLAMIPLTRQLFWGPMAMAIMGGLVVATSLTCLFLPALYAAWYRVREE